MAFGAPALSRQAMQQALRSAGALSNTGIPKSSIGEIGRAVGVPASSRYTPPVTSVSPLAAREAQKWAEEQAIEDMPLWARTLTTGPIGGFLNAIQKPLALTTSALKEGIDLFTGQEASWSDFTKQVGENYTFGRLIHDYDLLQGDGWQKWAARGVGFAGDVIFDPLNLLKPVGLAARMALNVAKRGTRPLAGQLARNAVLSSARSGGDDVLRQVSKTADELAQYGITWETLADDMAYLGKAGKTGKPEGLIGNWSRTDNGWQLKTRTLEEGADVGEEVLIDVAQGQIDEVADVIRIGTKVQSGNIGPTGLSGNDLRTVGRATRKADMDISMERVGADPFAEVLGDAARLPSGVQRVTFKEVDGQLVETALGEAGEAGFRGADGRIVRSVGDAVSSFKGKAVKTARDADNLKYEWGVAMPFTGSVGRALRIADPIERLTKKFVSSGAQYPVGLRLMTTETPYLGRMITGIPQGLRSGISKVGGRKFGTALLRAAGSQGDLKVKIRDSDDAIFRQRGKRAIHAVARGDSMGKRTRANMMKFAAPYLKQVSDTGADVSDVYYAIGGDADALAKLVEFEEAAGLAAGTLAKEGKELFDGLRNIANDSGMRNWLGEVDDYVPRQLDDDIRKALFENDDALIKYKKNRANRSRGKYSPTIDQSRKYVARESKEWQDAVAKRAADDGISPERAAARLRQEGNITDSFFGETLHEAGFDLGDGAVAGSVEKQIADQLQRTGADYSLFVDDIDKAVQGWIRQVSGRTGEIYAESLLMQEGILIDRMAEFAFMPSSEAVRLGRSFRAAQNRLAGATTNLEEALRAQRNQLDEDFPQALDNQINELREIEQQAVKEVKRAQSAQDDFFVKASAAEEAYNKAILDVEEVDELIASVRAQRETAELSGNAAQLEKLELERIRLMEKRDLLAVENSSGIGIKGTDSPASTAYGIVASSTAQRLFLENALQNSVGGAESFNALVRDLGSVNVSSLETELARLVDEGAEFLSVGPQGQYLWTGPDGVARDVERIFLSLDGILGKQDADGIGVWLGVEREIDPDVFTAAGGGNPLQKIDWALKKIDSESARATNFLDSLDLPNAEGFVKPGPDEVIAAKQTILDKVRPEKGASLSSVIEADDVQEALSVYFAGHNLPSVSSIGGGQQLDEVLDQVDKTLLQELGDVNAQIDELINASEAEGVPLRIKYQWNGEEKSLGIRDYVYLKQIRQQMDDVRHSAQLPVGTVRTSVDDIIENGVPTGEIAFNGDVYDFNGQKFVVKQQVGNREAASEVLSNALYRQLGLGAPDTYVSTSALNGVHTVSPLMDNVATVTQRAAAQETNPLDLYVWTDQYGRNQITTIDQIPSGVLSSPMGEQVFRGFVADAFLANSNVANGLSLRTQVGANQVFTRLDSSQSFFNGPDGLLKDVVDPEWSFSDVSEFNSLRNDPTYGPFFSQAEESGLNVAGLVSQQVGDLLDLRAQFGGFEGFVRRSVPGLSPEEAREFVEFLEVRATKLAESSNIPYHEVGSDDLIRQGLKSRGLTQNQVEAVFDAGEGMQILLGHEARQSGTHLNLFQEANNLDISLIYGDTFAGLNAVPGGFSFAGGEDAFNILLDLPQGANSLKVYGLMPQASQVQAAELAIQMAQSSDPRVLARNSEELANMVPGGGPKGPGTEMYGRSDISAEQLAFFEYDGRRWASTEQRMDQFGRVYEADPDFFNEILNIVERNIKRNEQFRTPGSDAGVLQQLDLLRWVRDIGEIDVSGSFPDVELFQKFKGLSFQERLQFAAWHAYAKDVGVISSRRSREILSLNGDFVSSFREYVALTDETLNPNGWIDETLKARGAAQQWLGTSNTLNATTGLDSEFSKALNAASGPGSRSAVAEKLYHQSPAFTRRELKGDRLAKKYYQIYQRSLSADGYSAAFWLNNEPINMQAFDASGNAVSGIESAKFPNAYEGRSIATELNNWPNFMLTNPAAARPADVLSTSQNLPDVARNILTPGEPPVWQSSMRATFDDAALQQSQIAEFNALPDETLIKVFHGTTPENAAAIRETGVAGYSPSGDLTNAERGLFIAPTQADAARYGDEVVELIIRKGDMRIPELGGGTDVGVAFFNTSGGTFIPEGTMFPENIVAPEGFQRAGGFETLEEALAAGFTESQFNASRAVRKSFEDGGSRMVDPVDFMNAFEANSLDRLNGVAAEFLQRVGVSADDIGDPLESLYTARAALIENREVLLNQFESSVEELGQAIGSSLDEAVDLTRWREHNYLGLRTEKPGSLEGALEELSAASRDVDDVQAAALKAKEKKDYLVAKETQVAEALKNVELVKPYYEQAARVGSASVDDFRNLETSVKMLIEADDQAMRMALDDFVEGVDDWDQLLDPTSARGWNDTPIHRMGNRVQILDDAFRNSWKPIGNNLQGPEAIVDSMMASERWVTRGGAAGFWRGYDKIHNLLRAYMIAKPGFHGRNFISGAFMNHLAGVNPFSYGRFTKAYWKYQEEEALRLGLPDTASKIRKAMRGRGLRNVDPQHVQYVRELDRAGALGSAGGQVASEFVEGNIRVGGRRVALSRINPASPNNIVLDKSRNIGMATETLLRGTLGFDVLMKEGTSGQAFDDIMKFHFDYSDLSDFERNVVKKVVPFYTWTRKNLPLMLEMGLRKPAVFNRYNSAKKEMEQGLEKPEEVPDWMVRGGAIQTPWKYDGESMFILPDLPFKAPLELIDPVFKLDPSMGLGDRVQQAVQVWGSQVTPLIKAPYEWQTKTNLWKGYKFKDEYERIPSAYTAIPGVMKAMELSGATTITKDGAGNWVMKDYELHAMAQLLPTFMDIRRIFPTEDRFQQRKLSNWISYFSGIGLRTNTLWEQERSRFSREMEARDKDEELRRLRSSIDG